MIIQCVALGMDADRRMLERERKVTGAGIMTATISTTYPALRGKDHLPALPLHQLQVTPGTSDHAAMERDLGRLEEQGFLGT